MNWSPNCAYKDVLILDVYIQALIVLYYGGSLVVKNEMTGGDLMTLVA